MILITGGAGYIGSHCALSLLKKNSDILIFDNLSTGHIETIHTLADYGHLEFIEGDLQNKADIKKCFENFKIDAVIHFAAFSQVGESVNNPQKYYFNNVYGTLNLLEQMLNYDVKNLIFSSTAATYGEPIYTPIDEKHPQKPINPYGQSKLIIENILDDYNKAYGLKSVRLRYFNVAGANKEGIIGEWHEPETHLIPNIIKSAISTNRTFELYGSDYNTKDGTCIRDYIDIEDLVSAHLLALEYLNNGGETTYFNIGTKNGASVKEVFDLAQKVCQKEISYQFRPRRIGDPESLVADNKKAKKILNWEAKNTLEDSISTAYSWENKRTKKESR